MSLHHSVLNKFINNSEVQRITKGKLHGGHLPYLEAVSKKPMNELITDIANKSHYINKNRILTMNQLSSEGIHRGGGHMVGGGHLLGGSVLLEANNLKNQKDMYHFSLNLTTQEFELLREIAVQLLGGKPSPMWEDENGMEIPNEPLESEAKNYEDIYRMPNKHATAKMLEAEYNYGKGGGFGKAFRHVAKIAGKVYRAGHSALKWAASNKDSLLSVLPDQYKGMAEGFLETANRIDDAVNPIVEATIDAVQDDATQAQKDKLKKMAEDSIKKVVEENVPKGKEIIKIAEVVRDKVAPRPVYAD